MTTKNTEIEDGTPPESLEKEVQTLRKLKASLESTAGNRKRQCEELGAEVATLKNNLAASNKRIHDLTIGAGLSDLAKEISSAPALWSREFSSRFGVVERDGALWITKAGETEPIQLDGKDASLSANAVGALFKSDVLSEEDKTFFNAITIGSLASGSGATAISRSRSGINLTEKKPVAKSLESAHSFGLK